MVTAPSPGILDRIRKALGLARDERGNPQERENARLRAEKLMRDHGVTEADVAGAATVELPAPEGPWPTWRLAILFSCSKARGCMLMRRAAGKNITYRVVGKKSFVEEALYLAQYLANMVPDEERSWAWHGFGVYVEDIPEELRDSFRRGMSKAFKDRLESSDFARVEPGLQAYMDKMHADAQKPPEDKGQGEPNAFADGYQRGLDVSIPDPRKPEGQRPMVTDGRQ